MTRVRSVLPVALALLVAGCTENTAPGNDREAALSPAEPPAEVADVGTATQGVATAMLIPQVMTDADLRNAPAVGERCLFRFTKVGLPVLVYGSAAVIKLNGKLVALPAANDGGTAGVADASGTDARRFAAGPVTITVRPIDEAASDEELVLGELVLRLADASDELGYHGYLECDS